MKIEVVHHTPIRKDPKRILVLANPDKSIILVDVQCSKKYVDTTFFYGYQNKEGYKCKRTHIGICLWEEENDQGGDLPLLVDIYLKPENEEEIEMIQNVTGAIVESRYGATVIYTNIESKNFQIIGELESNADRQNTI